ncbi:MAG: MBL fold metallo-hydrolase [Bacillota bacterium]|nr:MBL fold metallo-hydrolase [Bacillota bacterium]
MIIKWLGHSCFRLESDGGTVVITDPFNETVGYPLPQGRADVITVSHAHSDHNNTGIIEGKPVIIDTPGRHEAGGLTITGFMTYHDAMDGVLRGKSIIFIVEIDRLRICHLGDLGHVLSEEKVKELGRVDVLLIPIGGVYTIDAPAAAKVAESIAPNIIIPMHYKLNCVRYDIEGVFPFTEIMKGRYDVSSLGGNTLEVDAGKAKKRQTVIVMNYY